MHVHHQNMTLPGMQQTHRQHLNLDPSHPSQHPHQYFQHPNLGSGQQHRQLQQSGDPDQRFQQIQRYQHIQQNQNHKVFTVNLKP